MLAKLRFDESRLQVTAHFLQEVSIFLHFLLKAGIKGLEVDILREEGGLDEVEEVAEPVVAGYDTKKKKKKKKKKQQLQPEVKKRAKNMGLLEKNLSSVLIHAHGRQQKSPPAPPPDILFFHLDMLDPDDEEDIQKTVEHMQYRTLIVGSKV